MIRAYAVLRPRWPGPVRPVLVIAGDGPDRPRLDATIADVGGDCVHMMGCIEDVHAVHEMSALFTMSLRSEGTSIGLLEAMSAQLCPVVTDVGGNAAVLGEGLRHRLCEPGSPEAMARAWRAALSAPEHMRRDATAARERVEREFSARKMVEQYAKVYLGGAP